MKQALDAEDLHPYLMMQPAAFNCPDGADHKDGYHALPECPYGKLGTSGLEMWFAVSCHIVQTVVTSSKLGLMASKASRKRRKIFQN